MLEYSYLLSPNLCQLARTLSPGWHNKWDTKILSYVANTPTPSTKLLSDSKKLKSYDNTFGAQMKRFERFFGKSRGWILFAKPPFEKLSFFSSLSEFWCAFILSPVRLCTYTYSPIHTWLSQTLCHHLSFNKTGQRRSGSKRHKPESKARDRISWRQKPCLFRFIELYLACLMRAWDVRRRTFGLYKQAWRSLSWGHSWVLTG